MAHKIVTDVAHSAENPRLGPATEPQRAGRRDRRGARARGDRRAGLGQARPRTARRAARRGRRRRRRLRPDDHVRGRRRGAARRRAAPARPPRAGAHQPSRAQLEHYRFCTNFAVTGRELEPGALHRAARGARRLGARGRRLAHAEGPCAHRPARAATAVFADAGEVSRLDVADMRLQVHERDARLRDGRRTRRGRAARRARQRRAPSRRQRHAAGANGRAGDAGAATARAAARWRSSAARGSRELFARARRAHARRRADAEPVDIRPARRRSTRCPPRRWSCCPTART